MPRIPQAENQSNIRVGSTPTINTPQMNLSAVNASERAQAGVGEAITNIGKTVGQINEAINKVKDFRQTNEASIYHSEQTRNLETLAKQDSDIDPDKYSTEIDKLT